ncbi:branched-chain amino acid ABC transporter permease [Halobaculum sp. CBA1158]|uniref:branched-chain amino acid ABC transporter permease n=1 Tax=Halobaculum sp. CBA1158 TaxID=2904243 RepID=UPI001F25F261|nr:branched-chain amino acid ABC transporter permease [Halobaculum sp. CBA1158]UIP00249.1 branched-chain amino acid ABC transporter permease [Halobaculum sp. CBA1158]
MLLLQSEIASILLNGLQQGAIYALLGIGLTIILGTMEFLNLAHGALYLVGAYTGLIVFQETTLSNGFLYSQGITTIGFGGGFIAALILVPLVGFVVGLLMERYVAEPFYDRPETDQLLVTFGLALIVQEIVRNVIGGNTFQSIAPSTMFGVNVSQPISLPLVGLFPSWRLFIIAIAFVVIGLTYLAIERTDFGLVVQAGTRDSEMVRLLGIKINRSYSLVFALGAALAAFAGLIGASIQTISPQIGTERALLPAFLTIVVGGAGSVRGAIAGGLVLGVIISAMTQTYSQWAQIVLYLFVALMLIVKPEGLFGSMEVGE